MLITLIEKAINQEAKKENFNLTSQKGLFKFFVSNIVINELMKLANKYNNYYDPIEHKKAILQFCNL